MSELRCDLTGRQNNAIDLAKFICAILVVTIHIPPFGIAEKTGLIAFLNYGVQHYLARIAVPFFFITSGFFSFRKIDLERFDTRQIKEYVLKILRLYITWSIIYFPLNFRFFLKDEKGIGHAVLEYIRNFIFSGSYTHLWYLTATIFSVVLISFLLYKRISPKKIIMVAGAFYFVGLFAQSWFGFIVPLKESVPQIWTILKIIKEVIVTTRDGLFEGFLFIGIGMMIAIYKIDVKRKYALIGFTVSMLFMLIEVILLQHFNMIRAHDMYLFLVPATFYLFLLIRNIQLPDSKIYKTLRILSQLIFYMHLWVNVFVGKALAMMHRGLDTTCLVFIMTVIASIICAIIIKKLSDTSKFKWLKKIFS